MSKAQRLIERYPTLHPYIIKTLELNDVDEEQIQHILSPHFENGTHHPASLKNIETATHILVDAITNNKRIALWSDYDHDGISAAVIWNDVFRQLEYINYEIYIPDRHHEGFGLNIDGIKELVSRNAHVLMSADTGIRNNAEVAFAKQQGLSVIITDHHQPGDTLPIADAIVNPAQEDCTYPFKPLCGAGVAFKLIQSLLHALRSISYKTERIYPGWEKWLLDMVAIATVSDMVPLHGENRTLAHFGIKVLQKSKRPAFAVLCNRLRLRQGTLNETDIGFTISPRINAASRTGITRDAFEFFSAQDLSTASDLFEKLESANTKRKSEAARTTKEIYKILKMQDTESTPVLVLGNPTWRPALLGLVASKIVDAFHKPVLLWGTEGGGKYKGSIRTPKGISAQTVLETIADLFDEYGGHEGAGGFAIKDEHIQLFQSMANDRFKHMQIQEKQIKEADISVDLTALTKDFMLQYTSLRPFGTEFRPPTVSISGIVVSHKMFGKAKEHLECVVKQPHSPKTLRCIWFFSNHVATPSLGESITMLGTLEPEKEDQYTLWLKVVDIVADR